MSAVPKCKVQIGSAYQRTPYELRTPTEYQALMPRPDRDGLKLQRALLNPEVKAYVADGLLLAFCVSVISAIFYLGDKAGF